jgi:hypothetical protein
MQVSAADVGLWIGVVVFLIPAIKVVVDWIRPQSRRIEPQPLRVEAQPQYALANHTHAELQDEARCRETHAELSRTLAATVSEIRESLTEHDRKAESRASDTHERVNNLIASLSERDRQVAAELGELRGKLNNHIGSTTNGKHV